MAVQTGMAPTGLRNRDEMFLQGLINQGVCGAGNGPALVTRRDE